MLRNHSLSMTITAPAGLGTLRWMAPELFDDGPRPSKASDIYALGMVTYEVGPHCVLWRINPDDRFCRSSHMKYHSLKLAPISYLDGSPSANDPCGHRTERSLACRTRSGSSRRTVGMVIRPSGRISRTSCPPLRLLPAVGSPRPRKRS